MSGFNREWRDALGWARGRRPTGRGVTRALFARSPGLCVQARAGREAGRPISEADLQRDKEIERHRAAPAEGLREEFIQQWLETPCGSLKPASVACSAPNSFEERAPNSGEVNTCPSSLGLVGR